MTDDPTPPCRVCGAETVAAGTRYSPFSERDFALAQCPTCHFSFVVHPRTDFEVIYNDEYYAGKGADPLVDYLGEMNSPTAVRTYEWEGILRVVRHLTDFTTDGRWLDFGCGLGGLVRFLHERGYKKSVGFDDGFAQTYMAACDIPHLSQAELDTRVGSFDVVTSIEVIEHIEDPVRFVRQVAALLRPGGTFFLTTGNAAPYRDRIAQWSYVVPDVHVSFFEPATLDRVLTLAGLDATHPGMVPGYTDIIRYKVLKTLRRRHQTGLDRYIPWGLVARLVNHRFRVADHPVGIKPTA